MREEKRTLMVVHAHPDDESISTGGILVKYASMGVKTVVVYCTRGEEGDINNPDFVPTAPDMSMEEIRMRELNHALSVLGVESRYFLGYRDSGMAGSAKNDNPLAFARADIDEAVSRLVHIIREVNPDVVVTYNERGVYGHPDHIMANRVTIGAVQVAGEAGYEGNGHLPPWQVKKLYYTALPLTRMRKMKQMAEERGEKLGLDPEFIGTPDDEITTTIDVKGFVPKKFEALLCHESQVGPDSFFKRVPPERINDFFGYEHYVCISGCNMKYKESDLFEGIR